jgi:hypothetical protein
MDTRPLRALVLALACGLGLGKLHAEPATRASLAVETHRTSNALDNDLPLADTIVVLRGAISHLQPVDDGYLKLGAEFETKSFATYDFEDDRKLALSLERLARISDRLELRGTLAYAILDEGEDLRIGPLALGIRTKTHSLRGALDAGLRVGHGWTLLAGLDALAARPGATHFAGGLLAPLKLEADRDRLGFSVGALRTEGRRRVGATLRVARVEAERLGDPPSARSFSTWALLGEYGFDDARGTSLSLRAGAEWLRDAEGFYDRVLPVYEIVATTPLWKELSLRAAVSAGFETVDTDDPLASYRRRGELELKLPVSSAISLGAGVFAETRRNLLLENDEHWRGFYAEVAHRLSPSTSLLVRFDHAGKRITVVGIRERTTALFLRLSAAL